MEEEDDLNVDFPMWKLGKCLGNSKKKQLSKQILWNLSVDCIVSLYELNLVGMLRR